MAMEPVFRCATVSELSTLVKFMAEFYALDSIDITFDASIARKALEQILTDDSWGRVWLICWDDEIVGYVVLTFSYSLEFRGRDAFVDELYVRQNYRGYGIGTKALQFLGDVCASLGIQALHLEVERKNTKAQSFYRNMGFEDHDRYLMTKWIPTRAIPLKG